MKIHKASVPHPVFGETVCRALVSAGLMSVEKAGLLASRSSYLLRLAVSFGDSGPALKAVEAFVTRYSGATARDFHPVPYSPPAVAKGTLSR
jgi:hypothetical protein